MTPPMIAIYRQLAAGIVVSAYYPVYTTNRRRAGLVNAHQLVRFRQLFAFTLQQREQD